MKLQLYHALPSETAYIFSKLYFDGLFFYNSILICATIHNLVFWFWRYLTRFYFTFNSIFNYNLYSVQWWCLNTMFESWWNYNFTMHYHLRLLTFSQNSYFHNIFLITYKILRSLILLVVFSPMMMIKHHVWELMKLQLYHALPSETTYNYL